LTPATYCFQSPFRPLVFLPCESFTILTKTCGFFPHPSHAHLLFHHLLLVIPTHPSKNTHTHKHTKAAAATTLLLKPREESTMLTSLSASLNPVRYLEPPPTPAIAKSFRSLRTQKMKQTQSYFLPATEVFLRSDAAALVCLLVLPNPKP
jgi:hypothetical protein